MAVGISQAGVYEKAFVAEFVDHLESELARVKVRGARSFARLNPCVVELESCSWIPFS